MRKSQVSMEFALMLLAAIVFTTSVAWAAYYYLTDYSAERNIRALNDLGRSLQNEVILAYNVEPGYVRQVDIPDKIGSARVNITSTATDIYIEYKGSEMAFRIPQVIGNFRNGTNIIRKTNNGSVVIN